MTNEADKYAGYVDHPRYGRGPRYTGLDPDPMAWGVSLHWNSTSLREVAQRYKALTGNEWRSHFQSMIETSVIKRIPNTAIVADLTRQSAATVPVTHYFDLDRVCRDCGRPFLFFAEEQRHWYEVLGFGLNSDCVRCVPCRKRQEVVSHNQQRYEKLLHSRDRSTHEDLEIVACCLTLIEEAVFSPKRLQFVRTVLNRLRSHSDESITSRHDEMMARVLSIETKVGKNDVPPERQ